MSTSSASGSPPVKGTGIVLRSGKDVVNQPHEKPAKKARTARWADQEEEDSFEENKQSSSSSSSSSGFSSSGAPTGSAAMSPQTFIANMQFQPMLMGTASNTPQQQFAARNAELQQKGFTLSPITGQIFRLSKPKVRSQPFVDLEKDYASKRSEMIAYCRNKGYNLNPTTRVTTTNDGLVVDVSHEVEYQRLKQRLELSKMALKNHKQKNPAEFVPTERKRRRNVEALKRAAERRLSRLASRQVTGSSTQSTGNSVVNSNGAISAAIPAVANSPPRTFSSVASFSQTSALPVGSANTADLMALVSKLSLGMNNILKKMDDMNNHIDQRIADALSQMRQSSDDEEESPNGDNQELPVQQDNPSMSISENE